MDNNLKSAAEIFAETLGRFPEKIAVSDSKVSLTFRELDSQIRSIAKGINSLRANEGFWGYIPITVNRDVESAVLILACHLHDIPFAPIDPDWQRDRLEFVHSVLGLPPFFITTDHNVSALENQLSGMAAVQGTTSILSFGKSGDKEIVPPEANLGYAILTSGTTGTPKSVAFDSLGKLKKLHKRLELQSGNGQLPMDQVFGTLSYPFFFTAGLSRLTGIVFGQSLRLVSSEEMTVDGFVHLVRTLKPNRISAPPSLLILLANSTIELPEVPYLPSVKEVTWGGDAISYATISRLNRFFGQDTRMEAGYGASEAYSPLSHVFRLGDCPESGPMPLGRMNSIKPENLVPLEGLDDHFVLMLEEPMATGYLGNPELTSQKFITSAKGKRQWYSGDVVEIDKSGLVWHKGRVDDLVKIRGKLTSPSEATRALLSIKGVQDAVVLSIQGETDKQLVAHVEKDPKSRLTSLELRKELARRLPAHLIPHKIMRHKEIPKNSRGKPDREALLNTNHVEFRDTPLRTPLSQLEYYIWVACRRVLAIEDLSIDDELIDFGMDSLAALELETILQEDLPGITLDSISQHKTIEQLAKYLTNTPEGKWRQDGNFNPSGELSPAFAFPGAGNRIAHFVNLASEIGSDQPLYVSRHLEDDPSESNTSIRGRAERVFDIVLESNPSGPVKILGYSAGGVIAYELARLCALRGYSVDLTLFDPSIELMRARGYSLTNQNSFQKNRLGAFTALRLGFKRQGAVRSLKVLFVQKPTEFLISKTVTRGILRFLTLQVLGRISTQYRTTVTELLVAEAVRSYECVPIAHPQLGLVRARYFYVAGNSRYQEWSELLPSIEFLPTGGKHESILLPPNVMRVGEKLREEWGTL